MLILTNSLRPVHVKRDPMRVRTWSHDEVVLQLSLVAVVNQVNTRINSYVLHLPVSRNIRPPLRGIVTDEVVTRASEFIHAGHLGRWVSIAESHTQHSTGFGRSHAGLQRAGGTGDLR